MIKNFKVSKNYPCLPEKDKVANIARPNSSTVQGTHFTRMKSQVLSKFDVKSMNSLDQKT